MKVAELADIRDPLPRLLQSHAFLQKLKVTEELAAQLRDSAIVELREQGISQQVIADHLGISQQRVNTMERRARDRQTIDLG